MSAMTTYLISAGVLAVLVLAVTSVVGGRQMSRVLREFDAAPGVELEPEPEPEPSWSESIGWYPDEQLREILRQAADELWRERMVADLTGPDVPQILAELVARRPVLAIGPAPRRELPAAPKRRTRRTKTTIGATS